MFRHSQSSTAVFIGYELQCFLKTCTMGLHYVAKRKRLSEVRAMHMTIWIKTIFHISHGTYNRLFSRGHHFRMLIKRGTSTGIGKMKNGNISLLVPSLTILYFVPTFHFAVPFPRSLFSVLRFSNIPSFYYSSLYIPSSLPHPRTPRRACSQSIWLLIPEFTSLFLSYLNFSIPLRFNNNSCNLHLKASHWLADSGGCM